MVRLPLTENKGKTISCGKADMAYFNPGIPWQKEKKRNLLDTKQMVFKQIKPVERFPAKNMKNSFI